MNYTNLMGRMTKDAELKYTSTNQTANTSFTLAVPRRFQKQGEEKQSDFINCVAWGKTAEFITKYFGKGRMIAVVGRIQTRNWEDDQGKKHYVTEVVVEQAYFTGEKKEDNGYQPNNTVTSNSFVTVDDDLDSELPF